MIKANSYNNKINKTALLAEHSTLVKRIAYHLLARLPPSVLVDDLIQSGVIGLFEAANNFNNSKGASFETFAGIRIRGAMLDEIRRGDWTPRSVHKNSRLVSQAINTVETVLGRDATDFEVAEELNVSLSSYHQMLNDASSGKILGIDDLGVSEDALTFSDDCYVDNPYQAIEHSAFRESLAKGIKSLPEREALVLSLYYDEELNLREIGQVLDISESRVSQIHSQAMHRLKARMISWQN